MSSKKRKYSHNILRYVLCFVVVFGALAISQLAEAATLSLVSADGANSYQVGQIFSIVTSVGTSADEDMNAVSATVSYPSKLVKLTSVDKTASIINFWIVDPSYDNTAGTAQFQGGVYNPGYTGPAGKIVTLKFMAVAAGTADIVIKSASVLANDGLGTEILSSTNPIIVNITPAKARPAVATTTPVPLDPPVLDPMPGTVTVGNVFAVSGTSYPSSTVTIYLKDSAGGVTDQSIKSDMSGKFQTFLGKNLPADAYMVSADAATDDGRQSPRSTEIPIIVQPSVVARVAWPLINILTLFIIIVGIVILCSLWTWYLLHRFGQFRRKVRSRVKHVETRIHTEFRRILDGARSRRKLTPEEERIASILRDNIKHAEEDIEKEVEEIDN